MVPARVHTRRRSGVVGAMDTAVEPADPSVLPSFDEFFRSTFAPVARAAALVARDAGVGQELAQEAFFRLYVTSGPSYDDADYHSDVFVMDSDGSHVHRLTEWNGFDWFPTWSPDGEWIAFASDRNATPDQQRANERGDAFSNISIFAMRADGTDVRELVAARPDETLLPGSWRS